jgi:hypothetical protein
MAARDFSVSGEGWSSDAVFGRQADPMRRIRKSCVGEGRRGSELPPPLMCFPPYGARIRADVPLHPRIHLREEAALRMASQPLP